MSSKPPLSMSVRLVLSRRKTLGATWFKDSRQWMAKMNNETQEKLIGKKLQGVVPMNRLTFLAPTLVILLAAVAAFAQGNPSDSPLLPYAYQDTRVGQSSNLSVKNTKTLEQRNFFRECVYKAELGRQHLDELANDVKHSRLETDKVRQHLTEVRGSVTAMLDDHHRFILDLTEEQWNAAKSSITELEQLRATINTQLEGIDAELMMPAPDSKVLTRYTKKTGQLLRQWQEQHRKMGAALGMKDL
jgi:hypothetical protein